ncbi:MAG: hypothetical protein IPI77_02900 [Saprospiraceae bacterium]|nr:hypothetical protein [Saprospiraceae bacterium]
MAFYQPAFTGTPGWNMPVLCNIRFQYELPCIANDDLYQFHGQLKCSDSCGSKIDYSIINNSTTQIVLSGIAYTNSIANNLSQFSIQPGISLQPGNYQLILNGLCGSDTCKCRISFIRPECPSDTCCLPSKNIISNSGFTTQLDGDLTPGSSPWYAANLTPQIGTGDNCVTPNTAQMWGNSGFGEVMGQTRNPSFLKMVLPIELAFVQNIKA